MGRFHNILGKIIVYSINDHRQESREKWMRSKGLVLLLSLGLFLPGKSYAQDILLGEISFSNGTPARVHLTDERSKYCPTGGDWFVATAASPSGKSHPVDPLCWTFGSGNGVTLSDASTGSSQEIAAGIAPGLTPKKFSKFLHLVALIRQDQNERNMADMYSARKKPTPSSADHRGARGECQKISDIMKTVARRRDSGDSLVDSLIFLYGNDLNIDFSGLETETRDLYKYRESTPREVGKENLKFCLLKKKFNIQAN